MAKLNLIDATEVMDIAHPSTSLAGVDVQVELDRSSYNAIMFPKKADLRYTKLNQAF